LATLDRDTEAPTPGEARFLEPGAIGQIAMGAGIGATAGNVLYSWLFGPAGVTHWTESRAATELLGILLSVFFVVRYWEPWIVSRRAAAGIQEHPQSVHILRWRLRGFLAILLIIVGNEVLQHMAREDAVNAVAAFLSPFVITYAWVLGAQQHPARAALYGTLASFILGVGLFWEALLSLGMTWGVLPNMFVLRTVLYGAALTVFIGFSVGLALDRRWGRHVQWTAMWIIVGAQVLLGGILFPLIESRLSGWRGLDWQDVILFLMKTVGWGLGLTLSAPANTALNYERENVPPSWAVARGRSVKAILIAGLILVLALIYPTSQSIITAARKQESLAGTKIQSLTPADVDEAISYGNSLPPSATDIVDEGNPHRIEFGDFGYAIVFTPWLVIANEAHRVRVQSGQQATVAQINVDAIMSQAAGWLTIQVLGKAAREDFWKTSDGEIRQGTTAIGVVSISAWTLGPTVCTGVIMGCYGGVIKFTFPTEKLDRGRPADFTMVVQGKRYQTTINLPGLR